MLISRINILDKGARNADFAGRITILEGDLDLIGIVILYN